MANEVKPIVKFTQEDLNAGNVQLTRSNSGRFQQVRDIVARELAFKGEMCFFYSLVTVVQRELKMKKPQMAYQYLGNALEHDKRFQVLQLGDKAKGEKVRNIISRINGPEKPAATAKVEKAIEAPKVEAKKEEKKK